MHFINIDFRKGVSSKGGETKIADFNMGKMEIEYDYETDQEQIDRAKTLLTMENFRAVEYFATDDPIALLGNLN